MTSLQDAIIALKEQNKEQNESLLQQLIANDKAAQERFNAEQQSDKNEKNEEKLTGKDKDTTPKSTLGGMVSSGKEKLTKAGGGSLGLGLGRFALGLGALTTGLMAFTDGESFKKAGEFINKFTTKTSELLDNIGIEFPSLESIVTEGNRILGSSLDGLNAILDGDFEAFKESVPGLASATSILVGTYRGMMGGLSAGVSSATKGVVNAAKSIGGGISNAVKGVGSGLTSAKNFLTDNPDGAERMNRNAETGKSLTDKQKDKLAKEGFKVDKAGNMRDAKGKFVKADKADELLKSVGAKTSKKMGTKGLGENAYKAGGNILKSIGPKGAKILGGLTALGKKIPVLGHLLGAGTLTMIAANDELSMAQKVTEATKVLAGLGGGTLGAIAGAGLLGTVGGPFGAIAGGIGGGIVGSLFAEEVAGAIASAIFGETPTVPENVSAFAEATQGSSSPQGMASGAAASPQYGRMKRAEKFQAQRMAEGQAQVAAASNAGGGNTNVVAPQTTTNNIGGANAMITGGLTPVDPFAAGTS